MLSNYIDELKKIKLLSREEELLLWEKKAKGDINAHHKIITSYQPLVFKIAMSFRLDETKVLELIQEGTVGLLEAASKFDYTKGVAFSLYASHRIKGRMVDYLVKETGERSLSLDSSIGEDDNSLLLDTIPSQKPGPQEVTEEEFFLQKVKSAMDRLSVKEQKVLKGIYIDDKTVKELAADIEVTTSHVYRLQKKGVRRIRGMLSKFIADLKN
jgi:RNA polymerase sporulation-specific sigma factor